MALGIPRIRAGSQWLAIGVAIGACSSSPGKVAPKDAATHPMVRADAQVADAGSAAARPTTGDLRVRLEWADVPVVARASPGKTPCGTPRAASVMPTTTWGVPEAIVMVDGAATGEARVALASCTLSPRVALGASLAIASATDRPAKLVLARRGDALHLDALGEGAKRTIMLPVAGHEVATPLEPGAVYEVATDAPDPEVAWIVAARGAVTDPSGQAILHDLAPGAHTVTGWLPPRAGQPARIARAEVTVVVGDIVDVTLDLAKPKPGKP